MRSIYHLKESDPRPGSSPPARSHQGRADGAAVRRVRLRRPEPLHAELFARGLDQCGLRHEYGSYIDDVPAEVLEENNAMSLFGLNRRLRGAALGHLAAFEVTSSVPSRRWLRASSDLGLPQAMIDYYLEHVEADAVHEQLAVRTICGSLARGRALAE